MKYTIVKLLTTIFIIAWVSNANNLVSLEQEAQMSKNTINTIMSTSSNYGSSNLSRGSTIKGKEIIVKDEQKQESKECLGTFKITAYSSDFEDTGKNQNDKDYGITKSGARVQDGVTIASDWKVIKPGTKVYIENIGYRTVQDAGGAIKGNKIDLYIRSSKACKIFGVKYLKVYIIKE